MPNPKPRDSRSLLVRVMLSDNAIHPFDAMATVSVRIVSVRTVSVRIVSGHEIVLLNCLQVGKTTFFLLKKLLQFCHLGFIFGDMIKAVKFCLFCSTYFGSGPDII